jgi:hypothetical protein
MIQLAVAEFKLSEDSTARIVLNVNKVLFMSLTGNVIRIKFDGVEKDISLSFRTDNYASIGYEILFRACYPDLIK